MERSFVVAALGPTNTGKTHRAIGRMLDHDSGMMGLPLRLLAREVYDRVSGLVGQQAVALVTGEEKRVPPRARYFICTVEAMPIDREVDFLAVDEIQLAEHPERGHVFTERLLHARGRKETWFMGSGSMERLVSQLVPTAQIRKFPRLSSLKGEGSFSLGSLPRRSAVVAFSGARVYELAEKLRARKGGAAVVLGALSPRARNAQVALYQSGEVDYLVATDAIGMGLNLDIDRVAFADTQKFDGREVRQLSIAELSQIAGRAGRYTRDGAFGTFMRPGLDVSVERAIESHRVAPPREISWRNHDLDFSSPGGLISSLKAQPHLACLRLVESPEDTETLEKLLERPEVKARVTSEPALRLLWDVCKIPDYRKLLVDEHALLLEDIFRRLIDDGVLSSAHLRERLDRLRNHSGEIDSIMGRIAFVRTWTYVATHGGWTEDDEEFQLRTATLEDELSDALHASLVERFVQRTRRTTSLNGEPGKGHPENNSTPSPHRASFVEHLASLKAALEGNASLADPIATLVDAPHERFSVALDGAVVFDGVKVARLRPGRTLIQPEISLDLPQEAPGLERQALIRLRAFVQDFVGDALGPLLRSESRDASSQLRGILYQLRAGLGCAPASELLPLLRTLGDDDQRTLGSQGFVLGKHWGYLRSLLRPPAIDRRAVLCRSFFVPSGHPDHRALTSGAHPLAETRAAGRPSFVLPRSATSFVSLLGYAPAGRFAVRVDLVEKLLENEKGLVGPALIRWVSSVTSRPRREAEEIATVLFPTEKARRKRPRRRGPSPQNRMPKASSA